MKKDSTEGKIGYLVSTDFAPSDILYMIKDLPDACCIFKVLTDPFGTVKDMLFLFANDKYSQLVGKAPAELIGSTYFENVDNRDEDWIKFSYQAAILRQSTIMRTYNSKFNKWFEFWAVPVYQKGFCAFIIHDVTVTKKNEDSTILTTNTNQLIIDCAKAVSSAEFGKGIKKVLKILGKSIAADRVYIVEIQDNKPVDVHSWLNNNRNANLPSRKVLGQHDILGLFEEQLKDKSMVVINDTSVLVQDHEELYNEVFAGSISRYIVVGLKDKKRRIGYLVADNYSNSLDLNVVEAMESIAIFIAGEMRNRALTNEMMYMGSHDSLTGLGNRYALNQTLILLSDVSMPVGVCYSDINGLKGINDVQGHLEGDKRIKEAADLVAAVFNKKHCYRIGGDEFIAIVPEVDKEIFDSMVQKLKVRLNKISVSVGHVWIEDSRDIKSAIRQADEAMYDSKVEYYKQHERRHKS